MGEDNGLIPIVIVIVIVIVIECHLVPLFFLRSGTLFLGILGIILLTVCSGDASAVGSL